jgi:hypothetical protein
MAILINQRRGWPCTALSVKLPICTDAVEGPGITAEAKSYARQRWGSAHELLCGAFIGKGESLLVL